MSVFDRMDQNLARQFNTNGAQSEQAATQREKQAAANNIIQGLQSGAIDIDKLSAEDVVKMASVVHAVQGDIEPTPQPTEAAPHNKEASTAAQQGEQLVDELVKEFVRTGLGQEAGEKYASVMVLGGKVHAHAQWTELQNIAHEQQVKEAQADFMKISGAEWMAAIQAGEIDLSQLNGDQSAYILQKIAEHKQGGGDTSTVYPNQGTQKVASLALSPLQKTAAVGAMSLISRGEYDEIKKLAASQLVELEDVLSAHLLSEGYNVPQITEFISKVANQMLENSPVDMGAVSPALDRRVSEAELALREAQSANPGGPQGMQGQLGAILEKLKGGAHGADQWMQNLATKLPGIGAESAPWLKRLGSYGPAAAALGGGGLLAGSMMGGGKQPDPAGGMTATASASPAQPETESATFNDKDYESEVVKVAQAILTINGQNHGSNPFDPKDVHEDAKKLLRSKGWNLPTE